MEKVSRRFVLVGSALFSTHSLFAGSTVKIAVVDANGRPVGVKDMEKVKMSNSEWLKKLSPEQFHVTREKGTERAFTGKYADHHGDGVYNCICCGTALFD